MPAMKKRGRKSVWKNEWYAEVHIHAKDGLSNRDIAQLIGVSFATLNRRIEKDKSLRIVLKKARKGDKAQVATFQEYVFDRLPEYLKETWNEIQACETADNAIERMESLLAECGRRGRQHLFLFALVQKNFDITKACRSVNIGRSTFERWVTTDPRFNELVEEIHLAKKDFFESCLVGLAKEGNVPAILMANQTLNSDRGYGKTKKVVNEGTVLHAHTAIPINELDLTLDERKRLLDAYRAKQGTQPALPVGREDL